jgi:hypothetical protein
VPLVPFLLKGVIGNPRMARPLTVEIAGIGPI